eukprot:sb/3478832/
MLLIITKTRLFFFNLGKNHGCQKLALGPLSNHPETLRDISSRSPVIINPGCLHVVVCLSLSLESPHWAFSARTHIFSPPALMITGERLEISLRFVKK